MESLDFYPDEYLALLGIPSQPLCSPTKLTPYQPGFFLPYPIPGFLSSDQAMLISNYSFMELVLSRALRC